ncbi:MAG: NAD-dependent epimerase/dehydratase family protein [Bacteroidales bacterium]|jgi:CDP-paratose 2-epimerase|nr:NAD-dependent epimerase/dehydratase family protein [Bacteroidales bacterium]
MNNERSTILIAGGAGFVGSNLAVLLKTKYPQITVIALDNLMRRGSELNLSALKEAGVEFIHGDIRNKEDLQFDEKIDIIIDAAAEPSVLAGLNGSPDYLINTNLNGTINLLSVANHHKAKFIFLSTSRIYPIAAIENIPYHETETRFEWDSFAGIDENFTLKGARSFYGTTKLAGELILQEYETFSGLKAVINRCGVIAGPRQMGKVDQGVVVLWMARHFWKKSLSYIGYGGQGKQVRDCMHILDLFDLIDFEINNFEKVSGKVYNVGGGEKVSFSLLELTLLCEKIMGNKIEISSVKETRSGDLPIYITDNSFVAKEIGWTPKRDVETILTDIYEWIKTDEKKLQSILK